MVRRPVTPARPVAARDRAAVLPCSEVQGGTAAAEGNERGRAEQCTVHASTDCSIFRAEQTRRTDESLRAETAFRDWSKEPESERPLVKHRDAHVRVLREWMAAHGVSKCRLADWLGVHEKQVRKMLKKEVGIPGEVSSCIPKGLRNDYLGRLAEIDGGASPSIDALIARLDMNGALAAQRRVTDRIAKLATEGK